MNTIKTPSWVGMMNGEYWMRFFNVRLLNLLPFIGRRRVGKTYLIKTVFQQQDAIFFHVTGTRDASMTEQIDDFTRVIESTFYNNAFEIKNPENWKKAFELLTEAIRREADKKKGFCFLTTTMVSQ